MLGAYVHNSKLKNAAIRMVFQYWVTISELFKAINSVKKYNIKSVEDFGEGSHIASGEPYFYETCYKYRKFESNRNKRAAARIIANMKQSVRKDLPYLDPHCSDTSSSDESQKAIPSIVKANAILQNFIV